MTKQIVDHDTSLNRRERVAEWLAAYWLLIASVLFALGSIALFIGLDPSLEREHILVLVTVAASIPVAWATGGNVADRVKDPMDVFVIDLDATETGGALYVFPLTDFMQLEVVDGELDQAGPTLYFAKNVDLEEMTAEGTWRGTLTGRELLAAITAVHECRGMLEEDAQRAFALETSFWSIVYRSTKDATLSVVDSFKSGMLPDDGEGVDRAVNEALDEFGLEQRIDDLDDDLDDVDLDDLNDEIEGQRKSRDSSREAAAQDLNRDEPQPQTHD